MNFSRILAAAAAVATAFVGLRLPRRPMPWSPPSGWRRTSTTPRSGSSRSASIRASSSAATCRAPSTSSWHTDLVDPVRRDIVSKDNLQKLLRDAGVNQDSTVVLYGDNNNWFAAWGAWVFDIYGVKNVKLLDGGRKKWEAEKRELSSQVAAPKPGNVDAGRRQPEAARAPRRRARSRRRRSRTPSWSTSARPTSSTARSSRRPASRSSPIRAGHVPGAVNVPWGAGRQRGRHLQVGGRPQGALRRQGHRRLDADHHLLPHRRAVEPHLVRAGQDPRLRREELRRLVDRVRQLGRRADRERRRHRLDRQVAFSQRHARRGAHGQPRALPASP